MSYEELEERDLFLPEEHWGELDLGSSASPWLLALVGALGLVACVLIAIGAGRAATWVGAGLFVVFLYAFTVVSAHGVDRQNRRIDEVTGGGSRPGRRRGVG